MTCNHETEMPLSLIITVIRLNTCLLVHPRPSLLFLLN